MVTQGVLPFRNGWDPTASRMMAKPKRQALPNMVKGRRGLPSCCIIAYQVGYVAEGQSLLDLWLQEGTEHTIAYPPALYHLTPESGCAN